MFSIACWYKTNIKALVALTNKKLFAFTLGMVAPGREEFSSGAVSYCHLQAGISTAGFFSWSV